MAPCERADPSGGRVTSFRSTWTMTHSSDIVGLRSFLEEEKIGSLKNEVESLKRTIEELKKELKIEKNQVWQEAYKEYLIDRFVNSLAFLQKVTPKDHQHFRDDSDSATGLPFLAGWNGDPRLPKGHPW
ncbi:guanine nucleotide-binding protein subunit beta-5 [Striga asiatica]|uniref:Guanine nucleotide-binding protein subunit beta-5 n=1 Tax=Striga asiatica TaxID=4170 RepID=A0A5A7P002_STRAF|nr:guanine nucleotide-binding protein subunit beta-5 [Striga asiatica]